MSDLSAANCGCDNDCVCQRHNNGFGNNILFIILLFFCCGNCGNDNGCGCGFGNFGFGNNGNNCGCDALIWILLLSCFCGNNNGCDCGCR